MIHEGFVTHSDSIILMVAITLCQLYASNFELIQHGFTV